MSQEFKPEIINETISLNCEINENVDPKIIESAKKRLAEDSPSVSIEDARDTVDMAATKLKAAQMNPANVVSINNLLEELIIEFNPRMRTAAGRAHYKDSRITLNKTLLEENPSEFEQVVIHEFAHLASVAMYGKSGDGHGRLWKRTMRQMGVQPDRTHSMDTKDRKITHKVQTYASCGCEGQKHEVKTRLYNQIKKGKKYRCRRCKSPLKVEGV